jgi:hypothetical protein
MSFQYEEDDKVQDIGHCRLLCRPLSIMNQAVHQVCCLSDHVAIINTSMEMDIYEFSSAMVCRSMADTIRVARINHDDSVVFLSIFGSLHYLPIADNVDYSPSDLYLYKIPALENVTLKDNVELQVDYSKSLIVLTIFGDVYILNTSLKASELNPQDTITILSVTKYSVAGSPVFSLNNSVNICRNWGKGSTTVLAMASNCEQLELWPIHPIKQDDFIEWRRRRGKISKSSPIKKVENVIRPEAVHAHWISALSVRAPHHHESNSSLYASGDEGGLVVFWKLEDISFPVTREGASSLVAEGEHSSLEVVPPLNDSAAPDSNNDAALLAANNAIDSEDVNVSHNLQLRMVGRLTSAAAGSLSHSVTSIVACGDDKFWIGYSTGLINLVVLVLDPVREVFAVSKVKTISTMLPGGINDIVWRKVHADDESYRVFVSSISGGQVWEYDFQQNMNHILTLFPQVNPELYLPQETPKVKCKPLHKSYVELCDYCESLNLLTTSCCDGLVSIWDIGNNCLLYMFKIHEPDISKLCMLEDVTDKEQGISVIAGSRSGVIHEYFIALSPEFLRSKRRNPVKIPPASLTTSLTPQANVQELLMNSLLDSIDDRSLFSQLSNEDSLQSHYSYCERLSAAQTECLRYSCLPVSDIVFSTLKRNAAYCFGKTYVVIHSREHRRALLHLQLDHPLQSLGCLHEISDEANLKEALDKLTIVLQGQNSVKIVDALSKHVEAELDVLEVPAEEVKQGEKAVVASILWGAREIIPADIDPVPAQRSSKGSQRSKVNKTDASLSKLSVSGIVVVRNFVEAEPVSICSFDREGCRLCPGKTLFANHGSSGAPASDETDKVKKTTSPLQGAVMGTDFSVNSPVAVIWTLRSALAMRVITNTTDKASILRSVLFRTGADGDVNHQDWNKARIVFCRGLRMHANSKFSQMIIVLSDGFCTIVNV